MAHLTASEGAPQPGTAYPLVLGPTFDRDHADDFLTMRLDFIPASASRTVESKLHINAETGTAHLSVPSTADPSASLEFQGTFIAAEGANAATAATAHEGLDCVAVFDPSTQTFRLEALYGHTNLKYTPGAKRDAQPAQKPAAVTKAAAAPAVAQAAVPEKKDLGPVEADFFHGGMD